MNTPLVSAIITTYNREVAIVKRALDSVISQTYNNLEIILVNDCPEKTDLAVNLEAMAASYGNKVRYLSMSQNGGACAARNLGLENSHGEFIAFLDDDDEWLPDKILKMLPSFDNPNVGIVYCDVENLYEQTGEIILRSHELHTKPLPNGSILDAHFGENLIGSASFPIIRREALIGIGGFNTAMPSLQDLEAWLRILKQWEAAYVNIPLVRYHYYEGDRISTHPERRTKGYEIIAKENSLYLDAHPKAKAAILRLSVSYYINTKEFKIAFHNLCQAIRLDPANLNSNLFGIAKLIIRRFFPQRIS